MGKRKSISNGLRFDVFRRDGFTCQYCGKRPGETELVIDHINPVCNGGTNDIDNLVTSCVECNSGKSNKDIETGKRVSDGHPCSNSSKTIQTCIRLNKSIKHILDEQQTITNKSIRCLIEEAVEGYYDKRKRKPEKTENDGLMQHYKDMYDYERKERILWWNAYKEQLERNLEQIRITNEWISIANKNNKKSLYWKEKYEKRGIIRKIFCI